MIMIMIMIIIIIIIGRGLLSEGHTTHHARLRKRTSQSLYVLLVLTPARYLQGRSHCPIFSLISGCTPHIRWTSSELLQSNTIIIT
jgi:hypothetical protein